MHPSFHTSMRHDHASDLFKIRIHVQCFKKNSSKTFFSSMFFLNRWIWWWELDSVANKKVGEANFCCFGRWWRPREPRSRTSCRSPQGVPGSFPWPTIPQHYDEFHDIFRRRSLFSQQPTLPRPSVPCGIPFTLIIRNFSKTNISQCALPSYISNWLCLSVRLSVCRCGSGRLPLLLVDIRDNANHSVLLSHGST